MQVQPRVRTVAGDLEAAFSKLLRHEVKVTSAGRTDAGVHATGQVVSFKTQTDFPFDRLAVAANALLERDVAVREANVADDRFSARFCADERAYVYAIYNAPARSPLFSGLAYHVWRAIDLDAMIESARPLVGEHDFLSFCGTLPESGPTVRTVRSLNVSRSGDLIRIEIRADGFLHRMVRTIAGTLVECGTGRRDPRSVFAMLQARDRPAAGTTAPPHGLYLAGVRYLDGFDSFKEPPITRSSAIELRPLQV